MSEFETQLPLFPYQKTGAAFLYDKGSGLLGDEPGLGKTIMVMAVMEKAEAQKVLVFCPSVLKHQWANEIKRFTPHRKAVVIEGTKTKRETLWNQEAHYYIVNYELLLKDFELMNITSWDYIIADESTKIANPRAKQSKLIKKLTSKNRIAMSGTPISNKAQDCWNIIDFIKPGSFGNYWSFLNRYCIKNYWGGISAYQNLTELRDKLNKHMIRRLKKEVLPELPDRIEVDTHFNLSQEEEALQVKIKKELLFEIKALDISKLEHPMTIQYTLAKFTRLRQLANSLELLGENKKSSKLEVLQQLLLESKDPDRKNLVFSEFSGMCKILKRELAEYYPLMIIGETPDQERLKVLQEFNSNPQAKILILSSAGQYGLNITAASVVINYDLPFSLSKLEQRVGRAHRIGQKSNVLVYNLLGKGTADLAIKKIIHSKTELSEKLLMDDIKKMLEV